MFSFDVPCRECDTIIRIPLKFVNRSERKVAKCPKCGSPVADETLVIFSRIFAKDQQDLYHILGVSSNPTNEEIRSAYLRVIKHVHPDAWNIVLPHTKKAKLLDAATKRVNEIYDTANSDRYQKQRRQEARKKQNQAKRSQEKVESRARCDQCGEMVGYDPSHAGRAARCKHCGGVFQLPATNASSQSKPRTKSPAPEETREEAEVVAETVAIRPRTHRRKKRKKRQRSFGLFIAGGVLLGITIAVFLLRMFAVRPFDQ